MKYRHRVLALLAVLLVITYLDRVCLAIAGPRMQEALHIGPVAWGWVTGMFTIAYAAFEVPSGAMGDRLGPRLVLTRIVLSRTSSPSRPRSWPDADRSLGLGVVLASTTRWL